MLKHNHSPEQGTLALHHSGQSITYAQYEGESELVRSYSPNEDSLIPVVVLSSIEASNATNYFDLGSIDQKYTKYPWGLSTKPNKKGEEKYCATGGYNSCTHWVGEMPIGEKMVSEYSFPGYIGDDPYGSSLEAQIESQEDPTALRTQPVGSYTHFTSYSDTERIGSSTRQDRLIRTVWTSGMGREQFWSLVGDKDAKALSKGEWANPGWVVYNLLSNSYQERVPVVLVVREDASAPLNQAELDRLRDTIDPK